MKLTKIQQSQGLCRILHISKWKITSHRIFVFEMKNYGSAGIYTE